MAIAIYFTAALAVVFAAIYYFFTNKFDYWKKRGVVGPKPTFFFGNIKEHVLRKQGLPTYAVDFYNDFPNEKYVGVFRMRTPLLVIRDLDIIKQVMIKDFDCFVQRGLEFGKKGLGMNLFHAEPNDWKILRNKFTPTFTSGKLKGMFHLLDSRGDNFIEYLEENIKNKSSVDIYPYVQMYTKTGISSCAFGIDLNLNDDKIFKMLKTVDDIVLYVNYMNELDYCLPGILKKLGLDLFPAEVRNFFLKLVQDIFSERKGVPSNRKDFMDIILDMKNKGSQIQGTKQNDNDENRVLELTDMLVAANAFVFYVGGFETSASTMSFMLHELAYNQDIQDRLVNEINDVLEKHGKLTYEAIQEMSYLSQVFDETLRKYPVVDPLKRVAAVDYKIPGTDVVLEKGTPVLVSIRAVHYDPKNYPDPEKFDPERFSPENIKDRHSAAFLPFGIGPRNCIGMRFGQISSRVCIAKLLPKFRVEPAGNSKYNLEYNPKIAVLNALHGLPLKITPRNY